MPTVLVAGASGLVGFAAAKHFASLPGWKVVAVSRRLPEGLDGVELISVDLTDRARCAEVFGRMRDVTHLVYAALFEKPGLIRGWRERDQMETNISARTSTGCRRTTCASGARGRPGDGPQFPGGPPWVREAVDADLLARACAWATTSPACANEIFNINNGDVFEWWHVWPAIAETLGMDVGPDEPMSLAETLPPREKEWEAIVRKHGLRAPASFADFVGQGFIYADAQFAYGAKRPPPTTLVSTIKARQAGFLDCMDTEDMFRKWFRRFQDLRWLPGT